MRNRRVFLDTPLETGVEVALDAAAFQHLVTVLRLAEGDEVVLFNGRGGEFLGRLVKMGRRQASVHVHGFRCREVESKLAVVLAQACARGDRMDFILQKATELGVQSVVPLVAQRTPGRIQQLRRKREHWQGVVESACEQCGRNRLPEITAPQLYRQWLPEHERESDPGLIMDPGAEQSLRDLPPPKGRITIVVGPEGGFDPNERAAARAAGLIPVRLGPRVLRTETAGLTALAVLQALWGDLR
jgi:16S rRNA (uracil1498-N3)-methyltransferase